MLTAQQSASVASNDSDEVKYLVAEVSQQTGQTEESVVQDRPRNRVTSYPRLEGEDLGEHLEGRRLEGESFIEYWNCLL
jgi:hypothetical protein